MSAKSRPKFTQGNKVFAKVRGYPPWPARVEGLADETPNKMKYHIYFYGTGETAVVKAEDICSFVENKARLGKPKKHKNFTEALLQIEEELSPEELETLSRLEEASQKLDTTNDSFSDENKKNSFGKPKTSLSPKQKDKRKKLDESQSEDGEPKKKMMSTSNSDSESSVYRPSEVLSRSGRKIKPKRFADCEDESNEEVKPTCKVSPVLKTDNVAEIMKIGYLNAEYNNVKHKIPLNLNKPYFENKEDEDEWNMKVYNFGNALKKRIEAGEDIPNVESMLHDYTRDEALKANRLMHHGDDRNNINNVLRVEAQMLEIDLNIRSALNIRRPDTEKCLALLDKLMELRLTALMLKKHPEIVTTIRKVRRYIGSVPDNISKEEEVRFHNNATMIRAKAEHIYNKFQSLFFIPSDKSFWDVFDEEREKFVKQIKHLENEDFISMVREPEGM